MRNSLLKFLFLAFYFFNILPGFGQTSSYLLEQVNVVDVETGEIIPDQYVLIEGDKILSITAKKPTNSSSITIPAKDKFLIPGLWDMHTHYNWNYAYSNPMLIANGVTGIREMWGVMDTVQHIRALRDKGAMLAPEIYTAGNIVDGSYAIWPGSASINNEEEAQAELKNQFEQGVDFIKVYSTLSKVNYLSIAKLCREAGVPFAGHVPMMVSVSEAIEAGQQSMEHMYGILEECSSMQDSLHQYSPMQRFSHDFTNFLVDNVDQNKVRELSGKLAESNCYLSPTLVVLKYSAMLNDTSLLEDPRLKYMPVFIKQMWNPANDFRFANRPNDYYVAANRKYELEKRILGEMQKAGVKILAGTDYSNPYCYPGLSLHEELVEYVESGFSSLAALQTATLNPVIFMGVQDKMGTVSENKIANLVLLSANPLEDIKNTSSIEAVFFRGKYLPQKELENLMDSAIEAAANMPTSF